MIFRGIYSVLPLPSLNGWKVVWFNYVMIDHLVWFPRKEKYKGDLHVTFKYGLQFLSLSLSLSAGELWDSTVGYTTTTTFQILTYSLFVITSFHLVFYNFFD